MRYNQRNVGNFKRKESLFSRWSLTSWIIFVNVLVYFAVLILQVFIGDKVYNYVALYPSYILSGKYLWTLLTHMFMHGGVFHLFVNMFVLYSLGGFCEKVIGRKRFLWFYLSSGIFAGLLSVFLSGFYGYGFWEKIFGSPNMYMVGASGAIFGIAGLFVILLPKVRFSIIFLPFFSLPGYIMIPFVLVLTWLASFAANLPIGNVAHLGGFVVGIVYGYYLKTKYRNKIIALQRYLR
jgi:membrane associated rhomboid family serine protease